MNIIPDKAGRKFSQVTLGNLLNLELTFHKKRCFLTPFDPASGGTQGRQIAQGTQLVRHSWARGVSDGG